MTFKPEFIKPVRHHDRLSDLSSGRVHNNKKKNIETTIVLDLNILSKMKEVISNEINYKESGLQTVVKAFNSLPLYLSPGFSFNEVDRNYYEILYESWETFMLKYCPGYVDAPNSLSLPLAKNSTRLFKELPMAEKYFHAISYLSMLLIQVIHKNYNHLSPEQKFQYYVNYMISTADILSAIESEIAKYCFCDTISYKKLDFQIFCKIIKNNFLKGGNKKNLLKNALNSASDIVYYRAVAAQSNEKLDGITQDTWLLSADNGLKCIAKSVYFTPNFEGSDCKAVKFVRNEIQKKSPYWKYCDDMFIYYNIARNKGSHQNISQEITSAKLDHIIICAKKLEDSL
jgi:hypothetical protein